MILLRMLFLPFSLIYGLIISIRNKCFDWKLFKSNTYDFPLIAVGNLSTGGTGKTPHVEYLLNLLSEYPHKATLSRGYGRKSRVIKSLIVTPLLHWWVMSHYNTLKSLRTL